MTRRTPTHAVRKLADLDMICTASTRSDDYLPKLAKRFDLLDRVTTPTT